VIRCSFASPSSSLIASGSEDGLVYLWEREGSSDVSETSSLSGLSSPPTSAITPSTVFQTVASSHIHPARAPTLPRGPASAPVPRFGASPSVPGATTVRPFKALAGHGAGAVFDVRAAGGTLLSGAEDGTVGVWGADEE
jgi:WD40 repeat protein